MPKGHRYRPSEVTSRLEFEGTSRGERAPVVGKLIDNNGLVWSVSDLPPGHISSMRRHILERMTDVEDGKLLAAALGVRWRDLGDWPEDWPVDTEPE